MDAWKQMIRAQDGDPDAPLPVARESHVVNAPASGVLTRLDAMAVGLAAWRLGAGRARKEDPVQAGAGVDLARPPRRHRHRGPAAASRCSPTSEHRFERALASLEGGYDIGGTYVRADHDRPGGRRRFHDSDSETDAMFGKLSNTRPGSLLRS